MVSVEGRLLAEFVEELGRARALHPAAGGRLEALEGELRELKGAVLRWGPGSFQAREEALQVMVVAYRLLEDWEGDGEDR